jgi:hypothetical protein
MSADEAESLRIPHASNDCDQLQLIPASCATVISPRATSYRRRRSERRIGVTKNVHFEGENKRAIIGSANKSLEYDPRMRDPAKVKDWDGGT